MVRRILLAAKDFEISVVETIKCSASFSFPSKSVHSEVSGFRYSAFHVYGKRFASCWIEITTPLIWYVPSKSMVIVCGPAPSAFHSVDVSPSVRLEGFPDAVTDPPTSTGFPFAIFTVSCMPPPVFFSKFV